MWAVSRWAKRFPSLVHLVWTFMHIDTVEHDRLLVGGDMAPMYSLISDGSRYQESEPVRIVLCPLLWASVRLFDMSLLSTWHV